MSITEQPSPDVVQASNHAERIINRHFEVRHSQLHVAGIPVAEIADRFGTPVFIYDEQVICSQINELRTLLPPRFSLFYSIKANPNAAILRCCLRHGCGLEIASGGELRQALDAGCPGERLIFAGPGKTERELAAALHASIREFHIESIEEARCLNHLAEQSGQIAGIAIRVNPIEGAGGAMRMGGQASPFGIDEEDLDDALDTILSLPRLKLRGVHLYMATQVLDAATLAGQYQRAVQIARFVAARMSEPLATIDFGGGLGTPYFPHEHQLDLVSLGESIHDIADQMRSEPLLREAEGILEPGRFLVSESGIYLTRVSRVKRSRGKTFAILDGGMHHHLAASGNLGQTIKRNYPLALLNKLGAPNRERIEAVGPLCTPLDRLAREAELPPVEVGDLFGVFQSGAYARTSSPHGFLSHDSPAEVMVADGRAVLIRRRGSSADYVRDQCSP